MIHIRPGTPADIEPIARIGITCWQQCYRDFLPADFLRSLDPEKQMLRHRRIMESGISYFIAETSAAAIIGFASFGVPRELKVPADTELYALYLDPVYHRQGIGGKLLQAVEGSVAAAGTSLSVQVMEQNPFRVFYEKQGFQPLATDLMDLDGHPQALIVYLKCYSGPISPIQP